MAPGDVVARRDKELRNVPSPLSVPVVPARTGVSTFLTYISVGRGGRGGTTVNGIFDSGTFSMSLGGSATFAPTHEYHLGIWFNNPQTTPRR
ncbi:MAG: hypothetical protein ACRDRJ_41400 [Streptosporangiaceae bacterium]